MQSSKRASLCKKTDVEMNTRPHLCLLLDSIIYVELFIEKFLLLKGFYTDRQIKQILIEPPFLLFLLFSSPASHQKASNLNSFVAKKLSGPREPSVSIS